MIATAADPMKLKAIKEQKTTRDIVGIAVEEGRAEIAGTAGVTDIIGVAEIIKETSRCLKFQAVGGKIRNLL